MQARTRTSVALLAALAALAVLPASRAAQTCTQKFSGLKTCTLFNDQFATGDAADLDKTKLIESQVLTAYNNYTVTQNDPQCQKMFLLYGCINAVSHPQFPAAAPCTSTGARMKMCKALCVNYIMRCARNNQHYDVIDKQCAPLSAPEGDECFGDAGVAGMKSAAHTALPPLFAVVFLALSACLAM
jgi:hypothetical protein